MEEKIKVEVTCKEYFVADVLRELANFIEESDQTYAQLSEHELEGDNYVAQVSVGGSSKTMYALVWLSETADENCAGVAGVFATKEQALDARRKALDEEKADLLSRYDEEEVIVHYDCGIAHDINYNSLIKYSVDEVSVNF